MSPRFLHLVLKWRVTWWWKFVDPWILFWVGQNFGDVMASSGWHIPPRSRIFVSRIWLTRSTDEVTERHGRPKEAHDIHITGKGSFIAQPILSNDSTLDTPSRKLVWSVLSIITKTASSPAIFIPTSQNKRRRKQDERSKQAVSQIKNVEQSYNTD